MFRTRYIRTLIVAAAAVAAAACTDPVDTDSSESVPDAEPASLTIDFSVADLGVEVGTRAVTDTGTDTGELTLAEYLDPEYKGTVPDDVQAIEGSKMSCLTILLLHKKSNKIVAVREIPGCSFSTTPGEVDQSNGFIGADKDGDGVGDVDPTLSYSSRARVTFDYDNPLHVKNGQSVERLLRGEYRLFAIANYDHNVTTSKEDLPEGLNTPADPVAQADQGAASYKTINLQTTLDKILTKFHEQPDVGLDNFNPSYEFFYNIRFLMNCTIKDGQVVPITDENGRQIWPYIRPAVHQTLSATQNIYLAAGQNHISVELLRISSRTRVEVKNFGSKQLRVHSLGFSSNYTQCTNYLFRREYHDGNYVELADEFGDPDHPGDGEVMGYPSFTGAPKVSFEKINSNGTQGAILPFDETNGVVVEPGEKKGIFDALMYESYDDKNSFTYTIEVSYPEVTDYKTTDFDKIDKTNYTTLTGYGYEYAIAGTPHCITTTATTTAMDVYNAIKANYSSSYFLIENVGSPKHKYLYEQAGGTLCAGKTDIVLGADDIMSYLWTLEVELSGDNTPVCSFKNAATGHYIPAAPVDADGMTGTADRISHVLGISNRGKQGDNVTFATDHDGKNYYLSVWKQGPTLGGWNEDDPGCQYRLYPVNRVEIPVYVGTPRIKKIIPLTAFNDKTAIVEDVHEIQRNDFVRILVEVSYNPDKGDFDFEVVPWRRGGGDVTFN